MNRQQILAIVLGSIVALGLSGGVAASAVAASTSDAPTDVNAGDVTALQDEDGEDNETDEDEQEAPQEGDENETDEQDQQGERIQITDALETVANETEDQNATVVGAELGQRSGGLLDFGEDDESVYTVDALLPDGTHMEFAVNATNGSIVERGEQEEGFLEGLFGEENVPEEPLNLSAMHNATEAVELAKSETVENESMNVSEENLTVSSVTLDQRDDNLVYEVQMNQADDGELTVTVDAMKDGEGVIGIEGADGGAMDGGDEGDGDEGGGDEGGDEGNNTDEGGN